MAQTSSNVLVAIKRETVTGTAATAGSADQMRITDSPGLSLTRNNVQSAEKRDDGLKTMARLGGKGVDGSFNVEMSGGGVDDMLFESILRSTWVSAVTFGNAEVTSLEATDASTLVNASGSFITEGVRVGDVFQLSAMSEAANNDINLRVATVSAGTITVEGTPLTTQAADTAFSLKILKKITTPTTPTRYSHTVEQYDQDNDLTELFLGCRLVGLSLSAQPDAHVTMSYNFLGMDRTLLVTGTSPWFTTPTLTTGLGMIVNDATLSLNGSDIAIATGFDLNFQIAAAGIPVIGSLTSPDIFDNDLSVSGTLTGTYADFSNPILYDAETEFELSILCEVPGSAPLNTISIYLPRVKIGARAVPIGGGDGPKIETLQLIVGPKAAATGFDGSIMTIQSSAA